MNELKAIRTDETHYILTEDYIYEWTMDAYQAHGLKNGKFELHNQKVSQEPKD